MTLVRAMCAAPLFPRECPLLSQLPFPQMPTHLASLASALHEQKATLLTRWETDVRALPSAAQLDALALRDHIPQFVDEMIAAILRHEEEVASGGAGSPAEHGMQRLADGFDIKEVVAEYNVLRCAVHELAESAGVRLGAQECRVVNHIIDDAVAWAVDTFARAQAIEIHRRREEHFAFIAHDIRTPLNAIALTAGMLGEEFIPDGHEAADLLRAMQRNVQRIDDLVRRIMEEEHGLDAAEELRMVRREFDLWPLVHRLLLDLRPITDAAQIRISNLVPRHLTVEADASLLARALQNLVANAVKFAPDGAIKIGARETAGGVECWVGDDGAGIEPERILRIFEKRETDADPTRAGTGLGLAIFKQIVEAHGGEIFVESQPERGSTFRFTIPAQPRE